MSQSVRVAPVSMALVLLLGCRSASTDPTDPSGSVVLLSEGSGPLPAAPLFPTAYGMVTQGQVGPRFDVDGRILRRLRVLGSDVAQSESWIQETDLGVFLAGTGDGFVEHPLFMVPAEPRDGMAWEQTVTETLTWTGEVSYDAARDGWSIERGFVGEASETVEFEPGVGRASDRLMFAATELVDPEPVVLPPASLGGAGPNQAPYVVSMTVDEEVGDPGIGAAELLEAERGNAGITLFRTVEQLFDLRPGELPSPRSGEPGPSLDTVRRLPPAHGLFEWRDEGWRVSPAPTSWFVNRTTTAGEVRSLEAFGTGALEVLEDGRRTHLGRLELAEDEVLVSAWFRADGSIQGVVSQERPAVGQPQGANTWFSLMPPAAGLEVPEPPMMVAARHAADVEVCWTGEAERTHDSWRIADQEVVDLVPTRPSCVMLLYPWPDPLTEEAGRSALGDAVVTGWVEGFGEVTLSVRDGGEDGYPNSGLYRHTPGHVVSVEFFSDSSSCTRDAIDPHVCYDVVADTVVARSPDGEVELGPAYWDTQVTPMPEGGVVVSWAYGSNERVWYRRDAEPVRFTPTTGFWRTSLTDSHFCDHDNAGLFECFSLPDGVSTGAVDAVSAPVHLEGTTWLVADPGVDARAVDIATMTVTPLGYQPPTASLRTLGDGSAYGFTDSGLMRLDAAGYTVYDVPIHPPVVYSPQATQRTFVDPYGVYQVWVNWTFRYGWNGMTVLEEGTASP